MNGIRLAAAALIVAGILALAYGGFSYTKQTHRATLGSLELSITDKQTVVVPLWAGIGAMLLGGALLFYGPRKG
jgi:TRAP-type C4-dicarboxylate transport system permease small subunit